MKTSYQRITEFVAAVLNYKQRLNGNGETKFTYALDRALAQFGSLNATAQGEIYLSRVQPKLQAAFMEIDVENCLTSEPDGKGYLMKDDQGKLRFDRKGQHAANQAKEAWVRSDEFEFEPYWSGLVPEDLTEIELQTFAGFVFKDEQIEEIRRTRESQISGELTGHLKTDNTDVGGKS